jgi:hypothetical protein
MIFSMRMTRITSVAVGCVAVILALLPLGCRSRMEVYRRIESPDGRYAVVVLRQIGGIRFPGGSSDAAGIVRLVDAQGNRIREATLEMVQQVDRIEWGTKSVHITGVADWPTK